MQDASRPYLCESTTGVILAGGRGSRMGGVDKGLVEFEGEPLVVQVARRFAPQVERLVVNANRNLDTYRQLGYDAVEDAFPDYPGPLAGMASVMAVCATEWILSVPCDSPYVPADYAARMHAAQQAAGADIAMATCGGWQPVFSLLRTCLREDLEASLAQGERTTYRWLSRHRLVEVDFGDRPEAFLNLNRPEDHAALVAGRVQPG